MGRMARPGTFVRATAHRTQIACILCALSSLLSTAPAWGHDGNPNFRSEIRALVPAISGIDIEVLNYDDRLLLTSKSAEQVLVKGYDGEPYVRFKPGGEVQVNKRSSSFYLNEDRFAQVEVPSDAKKGAAPAWETVSRTGRYEWHDHRIHWMSKETPPQVKDENKQAMIFDWRVPIQVGDQKARLTGTLRWEPNDSSAPMAAYIGLGAVAIASGLLMFFSRRIRSRRKVTARSEAWG